MYQTKGISSPTHPSSSERLNNSALSLAEQLGSRLVATSEALSTSKPATFKVVRKGLGRAKEDANKKAKLEPLVSKTFNYLPTLTRSFRPVNLCFVRNLQPALSQYQKEKDFIVLKDAAKTKTIVPHDTPSPKRCKVGHVEPIDKFQKGPLPELPADMLKRQKSLTSIRQLTPTPSEPITYTPHPPSGVREQSVSRKRSSSHRKKSVPPTSTTNLEERIPTRGPVPLESLRDPLVIVERLKAESDLGFLYLIPIHNRHSSKYNPYYVK